MELKEDTLSSKNIFQGKLIDLNIDTIILPNGKKAQREIIHHPAVCGAIVVNDKKEILLVKQWRTPVKSLSLEIPAGIIDNTDTSPQTAMERELDEETGYQAKYWEPVAEVYTSPGFSDEKLSLFYCDTLTKVSDKLSLDEDEFLNYAWYSSNDLKHLISEGKITDLKTRYAITYIICSNDFSTSLTS